MTLSYDDLVTAATVGITRKPLAVTGLGGAAAGYDGVLDAGDPAAALLDAAALLSVARRAGVQPRRGVTVPAPPTDSAPTLSARAEAALRKLRWPRSPTSGIVDDGDLLATLLGSAADAGYVATGKLVTDLLDLAHSNPVVRLSVARVLGTRGRGLARYHPQWQDTVAVVDATADPQTWRTANPAERFAYLSDLRDRDPAAARDLLAAVWAQQHGRDRARFISVLSRDLSPADEEFLETALEDRAPTVRAQVRRMLARLPDSAFRRRGSQRVAGLLRLDAAGPGVRLVANLPGKPDPVSVRDGVTVKPPSSAIRAEAWWLTGALAAAPLSDWTARFRLSPVEIVALPVEGDLRVDVHAGWRLAAVSQGDSEWARALLDAGSPGSPGNDARGNCDRNACGNGSGRPPEAWPPDHVLAAALPPGEWAAVLLADVNMVLPRSAYTYPYRMNEHDQHIDAMLSDLAAFAPPWPAAFADAVIAAFDREGATVEKPRWGEVSTRHAANDLIRAAGRRMPAVGDRDYVAELSRLAGSSPFTYAGFKSAAEAVGLRRAFLEEIS